MAKGFARTKGFVRANEGGSVNEGDFANRVGFGIGDADHFADPVSCKHKEVIIW